MKSKKIKILISILLILSITLTVACAQDNDDELNGDLNDENSLNDQNGIDNQNGLNDQNGQNTDTDTDTDLSPPSTDQDVDLTERLLAEEEVADGQVYLRDEWAIGAITLNDNVSEERAQEIAQEYAELIKETYSDKKVNVQVILNGENVANIEL